MKVLALTNLVFLILVPTVLGSDYYMPRMKCNWTEAARQCDFLGMQLAVVDSAEKQEAIEQVVCNSTVFSHRWIDVWIGANDITEEGQFTWQANGENVTYANWKAGQPNNYGGKEDCVLVQHMPMVDFKWNDDMCSKKKFFICEKYCR